MRFRMCAQRQPRGRNDPPHHLQVMVERIQIDDQRWGLHIPLSHSNLGRNVIANLHHSGLNGMWRFTSLYSR